MDELKFNIQDYVQLSYITFLSALAQSSYISSTFLFLKHMGYNENEAVYLNGVAASSFLVAQAFFGFVLAHIVDHHNIKIALFLSQLLDVFANLLYAFTNSVNDNNKYAALLIARILAGCASSNSVIGFGYISAVCTTPSSRGSKMAYYNAAKVIGSVVGPVLAVGAAKAIHFENPPFIWDVYTACAWTVAILNAVTLVSLLFFKQSKSLIELKAANMNRNDSNTISNTTSSSSNELTAITTATVATAVATPQTDPATSLLGENNESNNNNPDDNVDVDMRLFYLMCGYIFFGSASLRLITGSQTTIVSPFTSKTYGWDVARTSYMITGQASAIFLSMSFLGYLASLKFWNQKYEERMFQAGYLCCFIGLCIMIDFKRQKDGLSALPMWRFILGLLIFNIGSSVFGAQFPAVLARISGKLVDPAINMARYLFSIAIGVSIAPILASVILAQQNEAVVLSFCMILLILSFIYYLVIRKLIWRKNYEHNDNHHINEPICYHRWCFK